MAILIDLTKAPRLYLRYFNLINDISLNSEFHTILFAYDTTLYDHDTEWPALFHKFNSKFRVIYSWITLHQTSLNGPKLRLFYHLMSKFNFEKLFYYLILL